MMAAIELSGLKGNNPMGFLAALGVISALEGHQSKLEWTDTTTPKAILHTNLTRDELINALLRDRHAVLQWPLLGLRNFKLDAEQLESYFQDGTLGERAVKAALISDIARDGSKNIKPTDLYFLSCNQSFTETVKEVAEILTPELIEETLFGPWTYSSKLRTFMWDTRDDRNYALMARNPSDGRNNPKMTIPGADWLAFRGLSLLPAFGVKGRVQNPGTSGGWKRGAWAWTLWQGPIGPEAIRTLIQSVPRGGQEVFDNWNPPRGVFRAYQSQIVRSEKGGYGTIRPPRAVWSEES